MNKKPSQPYSYFNHLLRYQRIYFCLALLLLCAGMFLFSFLQHKPLLVGGESYYYLSSAQQETPYHPLTLMTRFIPGYAAYVLPPIISVGIILLFYALARKIQLSEQKTFFMVLFYIFTPTFLFTSLSLSSYALYLLLALAGMNLTLLEGKKQYLALVPFAVASCFDLFSGLLLLLGLVIYYFIHEKSKAKFPILAVMIVSAVIILNIVLLKAPFVLGPFMIQHQAADFMSDLGSFSGVGFFSLLLALIGLIVSWEKKNILLLVPALLLSTTVYFFNTHTGFFLSLVITILAALGLLNLWEQRWKLSFLRHAVLLLLLLGLAFSTVSYLDRISTYSPTKIDQETLNWIRWNTADEAVVLSAPENSYYISYFAQRQPAFTLHTQYRQQYNLSESIFGAYYINELFPLLEENEVSIIYVSEDMKKTLPPDQGFLFLLQNERFKLLNSTGEAEVWSFEEEKQ